MADNFVTNAGSGGATFASDDIGGVQHPRVKIEIGADGTALDVGPANPMPVSDAGGSLTVDGTVAVSALPALVAGTANIGDVDVLTLPALPAGTNNIGDVDVLTLPALPAGTNNIGDVDVLTLPALVAGTANIGDVDVLTLPALPAGTSAIGRLTGTESTANSTSTPLGVGAAFTGTFENVKDFAAISISVFSDQLSAADGLEFQWSGDGTNVDLTSASSVQASAGRGFNITPRARFFRVKYTNGGTGQGAFRLTVTYHPSGSGLISRQLDAALDPENYGQTVRAIADVFDGSNFVHAPGDGTDGMLVQAAGREAHDAAVTVDPVLVGGRASDAVPSAVSADGDHARLWVDRRGAQKMVIVDDAGDSVLDGVNNAVRVNLVAGGGGGGTSQADRSTFTDGTTAGTPIMGVLNDTPTDPTEDQAAAVRITAKRSLHVTLRDSVGDSAMDDGNNAVRVNIVAGAGSGGVAQADESAFTEGTTQFTPIGGVLNDTITSDPTEDQAAAARITPKRAIHVNLRDAAGNELSVGGGTQYTEDAAAAANPTGTALNLVRNDARSGSLTDTDGDNVAARGTNSGELYVKHVDAIPVTDNAGSLTVDNPTLSVTGGGVEAGALRVTIANDSTGLVSVDDNGGSLTVDGTVTANAGTGTFRVDGGAAHDSPVAGNPNLIAGRASAAAPASVSTDGDAVDAWYLLNGAQATVITAAGALIGGDATNGLDVDITRMAALVAGTANIGDVDVLTVPAPLSTTGGGTEATALRVTIANDSTGLVSVDDNGASLTVDGAVTVTQSTAASLKAQVQGEAAHDAAVAGNPLAVGARANTSEPATAVADGDATWLWADKWGRLVVTEDAPPKAAAAGTHGPYTENSVASGDVELIAAPGASTSIVVTGFWLSNQGAAKNRVSLREGAAGTERYKGTLAADGGGVTRSGLKWVLPANTALTINIGTAGDIDANVDFHVQTTP